MDEYDEIRATRQWWGTPVPSVFHQICSLVTAQEVSFAKGRAIRQKLFQLSEAMGFGGVLGREFVLGIGKDKLVETGLSPSRAETLLEAAGLPEGEPDSYAVVRGIGPWTIKGTKLLLGQGDNIVLSEDKWIRQRLGQMVGQKIVTEAQAQTMFQQWAGHESLMSYFLWRAKPAAIDKLLTHAKLTRDDFV